MNEQLIVNIVGEDTLDRLSEISACVNDNCCNILDSRQAIYGKDFSLSMIVEGTASSISKLEIHLSSLCLKHDLLSMMKRTSGHHKQNIEQLVHLEFKGVDAKGILGTITKFLSDKTVSIAALRQATFINKIAMKEDLKCKMVLSVPRNIDIHAFDEELTRLMKSMSLAGKITYNDVREEDEHIESW